MFVLLSFSAFLKIFLEESSRREMTVSKYISTLLKVLNFFCGENFLLCILTRIISIFAIHQSLLYGTLIG